MNRGSYFERQWNEGGNTIAIAPTYLRPSEVDWPFGDATHAREKLG
jgi:GDP-D-mannose dehydratase